MSDIDAATSARPLRTTWTVTVAGVLVMLVGAMIAVRYTPSWLDPAEDRRLHGRCVTPESTAMLQASWWVVGAGFVVVLTGLALTWRALPQTPRATTAFPLPVWGRAGSAALVGLTFGFVLGPFLLLSFLAIQALPVGFCVFWLLQGHAVVWIQRRTGPARRSVRVEWSSGLSASAAAVVVGALLTFHFALLNVFLFAEVAVLAGAVLLDRALPAPGYRPSASEPVQRGAGTVIAAVAVGILAFAVFAAIPRPGPADVALPAPPPRQAAPPAQAPATSSVPTPTPPPVEASTPCTSGDLEWSTTGWETPMGTRAVTVVATHHGRRPCDLDGFAGISIAQGGRPLQLVVEPASIAQPGLPVAVRRVGVAPDGTASFAVFWKGYGAAADQTTPQTLDVVLPGAADPSAVPLSEGPAPFDVIDGATVNIDAWRAGPP